VEYPTPFDGWGKQWQWPSLKEATNLKMSGFFLLIFCNSSSSTGATNLGGFWPPLS
jgi:hypothetical protein